MMDARAAKLALARQKLKTHQEKKIVSTSKEEIDQKIDSDKTHEDAVSASTILTAQPNETTQKFSSSQNGDECNIKATEILISSKRNLELQVSELQAKLSELDNNYTITMQSNDHYKQRIHKFECDYQILQDKYQNLCDEIREKEKALTELNNMKSQITDENHNLQEQLELAKSMLSVKELQNTALLNELDKLQKQLDATQLHLQQLTNGMQTQLSQDVPNQQNTDQIAEALLQKNSNLELQLKTLQKEKDQINSHYEHYVSELNELLKSTVIKNEALSAEVQNLATRENNLIEQISDMEIRIQQMRQEPPLVAAQQHQVGDDGDHSANEIRDLKSKLEIMQAHMMKLNAEYNNLQQEYKKSLEKIQELSATKAAECDHDSISLSKLNADITSDKLAAQRATEQNKKLKIDLQELEDAFVKISSDKLELTEKVAAEKYLNRELTIKLAEAEEKVKDMHTKLLAKDEEMIRLQNSHRELERKIRDMSVKLGEHEPKGEHILENERIHDINNHKSLANAQTESDDQAHHVCLLEHNTDNNARIQKEEAMHKLQERFLKIMGDVAELSDEKHRLEHIILQLQNETDTICEYVALYQQQRSLLKKRDEERSAQIKLFQAECDLLKSQLEELSNTIIRLAQDTELAAYFQAENRQNDLAKVMNLLSKLKNSTLIDPNRTSSDLRHFYPCSCCSGTLIDV